MTDPTVASGPDDITCADCGKTFPWHEAYNQRDTPGSYAHNPPGHGDFRPRAFCPHCGFLVAEWDIDRRADRDQWRWHGPNAEANQDKPFPPDPDSLWGRDVPTSARSITEEEALDLPKVRELLEESERDRQRREEEKARQLAPDDLDGHCKRGFLHLKEDELDDAIAEFNGCLERRIDYAPAHRGLGWAHYLASRREEPTATIDMALSHLREAIRLDPGDGEAHFFLGIIHHNENREADAVSEWEKALELGLPKEREAAARSNLGEAYIARGQLAEAVGEFERAEALDSSLFAPHAYLRIIYEVWGEQERAEEERRQAERTCGGTSLTPSVRVTVRGLASSTPRPPVVSPIQPKARGARVVKPEDTEAEPTKPREEAAARRKGRRTGRVVGGIALGFLLVLCAGMGIWYGLTQKTAEKRTPTAAVTPTPEIEAPTRARPATTIGPAMTPPPPPTRPPVPTVPPTPSPEVITYTVRAGDTMAKIAAQFGVTVEEIVEANDIEDPNRIEVGQVLVIPFADIPATPTKLAQPPIEVRSYAEEIAKRLASFTNAVEAISELASAPRLGNEAWTTQMAAQMAVVKLTYQTVSALDPPADMTDIHTMLLDALRDYDAAMDYLADGIDKSDVESINKATELMEEGNDKLVSAQARVESYLAQFE